jgi:hypothetical protein
MAVLKEAKNKACPAFRDGRVYLLEFLEWYFSRDERGIIDTAQEKARILQAERKAAERENAVAEGQLHSVAEVESIVWRECLLPLRADLLGMPAALGPRCVDAAAAGEVLQGWVDGTLMKIGKKQAEGGGG